MSEQTDDPTRLPLRMTEIGMLFGAILGLIADDLILFAGGGLILGFAIGLALDQRKS